MTIKSGMSLSKRRPDWDKHFLNIAKIVATRSSCLRRSVGCVIVQDKRILASGYNGAPAGIEHCDVRGCIREQKNVPSGENHEMCWGLHAEQNALIQCAVHGASCKGANLYSTTFPCSICAKMIINAGIKQVFYHEQYNDLISLQLFKEAEVLTWRI